MREPGLTKSNTEEFCGGVSTVELKLYVLSLRKESQIILLRVLRLCFFAVFFTEYYRQQGN